MTDLLFIDLFFSTAPIIYFEYHFVNTCSKFSALKVQNKIYLKFFFGGTIMQDNDKLAMGERIRSLRENIGMSRDTFSEIMNVSAVFLRSIECGQRGMSIETLQKICLTFNVSSDYILFGKTQPNNQKEELIQCINDIDDRYIPLVFDAVNHTKRIIALTAAIQKTE